MQDCVITSVEDPRPSDVEAVMAGLRSYNQAHAGPPNLRRVHLFLRDAEGQVCGGLFGKEMWGWLYVEILWIHERVRGCGLGSRLLRQAESEAKARGCTRVLLDTFEFQAPAFYKRHGYEVFGVLQDFPPGFQRYYLKKDLDY
jgi:GNAT superfamily N-acetyltransferase